MKVLTGYEKAWPAIVAAAFLLCSAAVSAAEPYKVWTPPPQPDILGGPGSFGDITWGYAEFVKNLYDPLVSDYRALYGPDSARRVSIGLDTTGEIEMFAYEFSPANPEKTIYMQAGVHVIETEGYFPLARVLRLIADGHDPRLKKVRESVRFLVVPVVSVWGMTHKGSRAAIMSGERYSIPCNAARVNPNRDFWNEKAKETTNVKRYFAGHAKEVSVGFDCHTITSASWGAYLLPWADGIPDSITAPHAALNLELYRQHPTTYPPAYIGDEAHYPHGGIPGSVSYCGGFRRMYGIPFFCIESNDYIYDKELGTSLTTTMAVELIMNHLLIEAERKIPSCAVVTLFDASTAVEGSVKVHGSAEAALKDGALRIKSKPDQGTVGVSILGKWNLKGCNRLEIDFDGPDVPVPISITPLFAKCGIGEAKKGPQFQMVYSHEMKMAAGLRPTFEIPAPLPENAADNHLAIVGMKNTPFDMLYESPGAKGVIGNAMPVGTRLTGISFTLRDPVKSWNYGIRRIVAVPGEPVWPRFPEWANYSKDRFFPFIDKYGQFKFKDWPGKIHSDDDLKKARTAEAKDLAAHPGPADWSKYGGWAAGPRLKATGHFRVEKVKGKWWMVDPEGFLFWSHGPVRVTSSTAVTPLTGKADRTSYFEGLPPKSGSPFSLFYTTHDELLAPYYPKWGWDSTYDFSSANCYRKYGDDWRNAFADIAHRRLRSWGMNTIANSSDARIYQMWRTPFIERIEVHSKPVGDYRAGWWPIPDPYDPEFEKELDRQLERFCKAINSPWCIGLFVDNEHAWGGDCNMAVQTLKAPAGQAAKTAFMEFLKRKFDTVQPLNDCWKTGYKNWDDFLASTMVPDAELARTELREFTAALIGRYYEVIARRVKVFAPDTMYMGCRFAGNLPEHVIRPGLKYLEVVSVNRYARDIADLTLPAGIDKPFIIGEFHFGALDRGMFHTGLIHLKDQNERGEAYVRYVRSALRNTQCIGVHWHQFGDQATSGRFCGENFQVGLVDCCDTPYPETVKAIRDVGYGMYEYRMAH